MADHGCRLVRLGVQLGAWILLVGSITHAEPINRFALVTRHEVQLKGPHPQSPLQVGNGEFAFAFDMTGLQTFADKGESRVPLGTMAQWAWHTFPNRQQYDYAETLRDYDVHGRKISYATDMRSETAIAIRSNPHRFNLARIGLRLGAEGGRGARPEDLKRATQTLNLWSGEATSHFHFGGQPVAVRTVAHPNKDAVAFSIESPLVSQGRLGVTLAFAYPAGDWGPRVDNWQAGDRHSTKLEPRDGGGQIFRRLDATSHLVDVSTNGVVRAKEEPHHYSISQPEGDLLTVVVWFRRDGQPATSQQRFDEVRAAAATHWKSFWRTGGAIDLSGSQDPRWRELERRLVLSQYLTAIQCSGSMPPQETGLLCNSWHGKSHLEMHWWHAAHFPLWGRCDLLERSLDWYGDILPAARVIAQRQGYAGVRWPKMTGPEGVSSPSAVGELLVWQQPHPIYFAELVYRTDPTQETLERFRTLIDETATFMADYAHHDKANDRYVLGPVLIPAQECYDGRSPPGVLNPTFELAYWRWALRTANVWRQRLNLPPDEHWAEVAEKIVEPHVRDGVYTAIENAPFTRREDHPSMLAALGVLPDVGLVDARLMGQTLRSVEKDWEWSTTWGWDYPMLAMTAARLGDREKAIDYLLLETAKNRYLPNGHCRQSDRLPAYLPGNGGLLTAAAMMAAGWDGSDELGQAPGFPDDGSWVVKHEELMQMP